MKNETAKETFRKILLEARIEEIDSILAQCKEDYIPSKHFNQKIDKLLKDTIEDKKHNPIQKDF